CSFPVATGRDNATPTGEFPVLNKVENPTWYGPDAVVSANDPNNPLGEHWIDLGNGYGVHGTINPDSIGQAVSNGCVRLRPDDVALVYDLLTTNSKVLIRE
ncbi:MAG: L,D-transpeptidase, partial [Planctomyces sp.]|nr:L,D-transpeptidase [Planctomyces sp.]